MGRKKIIIEPIREDRNRQVTFMKRKQGLLKKAMELSILCKCEVSVLIFSEQGKMFEYASNDMDKMVKRREQHSKDSESKTNHDVSSLLPIELSTRFRSTDHARAHADSSRTCWRRRTAG